MKKFTLPLILAGALLITACGSQQEPADEVSQTEIVEMENASEALEESVESIDSTVADLDEALDSLDALFSEEQN
ncbi:hypothetical protein [Flavilitoribacter nigricans]|uniref:Lipoprotein n=1 Tax=Flavilitoribacter nigricans (strain ATCC 23147 / DSM 23189 / NBRC 102662 / NCIMB 1420 / SS-2) TaxID=1122177 RepID=A0A2D0N4C5_FLAN2|nr:hypothetical protein [Flavilitoribacter nigricans]PHN03354.1 hypothetical protein CRP01_27095 [Flavilitoribacter nigricans DSM 23189 = NBRC 102662]